MQSKAAHRPSTLDLLHIRGGHTVEKKKKKRDWAVWAPVCTARTISSSNPWHLNWQSATRKEKSLLSL